nr:phosphatase IMPL1, chloroplastic-like [Quercus suber]
MSEAAILEVVINNFDDRFILGEEGGIIGDTSSDHLWCIDPSVALELWDMIFGLFGVCWVMPFSVVGPVVGLLACWQGRFGRHCNGDLWMVEFVGDPMCWNTGIFSATAGGGAFCNGQKIHSIETNLGVRRLWAAAVDVCHVALGIAESYWEYCLKPWDMAVVALIVEEAGGTVTCMDGGKFCLLERIGPATEKLKSKGTDFSLRYKPESSRAKLD